MRPFHRRLDRPGDSASPYPVTNTHRHSRFCRNFLIGGFLLALSVELYAAATLSGNTADPSTLGAGNYNIGIDATGNPNPGTMLILSLIHI